MKEGEDNVRRVVDLSHRIEPGMPMYPGLPGPEITDHLSREASRGHYSPGTEFHIGRINMVVNTGTYLDTPFHRFPEGDDLATVSLERVVDLDGLVIDTVGLARIDGDALGSSPIGGRAVLVRTNWSRHWGTEAYSTGHPCLTASAADRLVEQGAALVGIDSLNIDATDTGERPVHSRLLAAGIPIVEHLCRLDDLPVEGFRFSVAPPAVTGLGSFPVRAFAIVPGAI
jgi:kynurenine formamidase